MTATTSVEKRPLAQSLQEYARGIAGGLLFSLPLLYTMEVWWQGLSATPLKTVLYIAFTFVLLLGYNRYSGLRRDARRIEVVLDSVEELGLGLVISAVFLWFVGQIEVGMSLSEIVGKVVYEGMTVAIGVSVGTAQLGVVAEDSGQGSNTDNSASNDADGNAASEADDPLEQVVLAFCGAVLFAANVAPTDEIFVISVESEPYKLLLLAFASLAVGTMILFASDFTGTNKHVRRDSNLNIVRGLVITYAVALVASTVILWFFGRFEGVGWSIAVAQIVVLGAGATLGASAGRLLLQ